MANNKDPDQTVRMDRLACAFVGAFVVCNKQQSQGLSHQGPFDIEALSEASWPLPEYGPGPDQLVSDRATAA